VSWQILILLHSLVAAFSILLVRILAKNGNKYVYSVLFFSFISIWLAGSVVAILILEGDILPNWDFKLTGQLILGGVLFGMSNFLVFEVLRKVPATVTSINLTLSRIFAVFFAIIFLGESLSINQFFGAILMLIAVALVSYHRKHKKLTRIYMQSLVVIFIISIMYGLAVINEKYLLDELGIRSYMIFGWFFQALVVSIIVYLRRSKWKLPQGKLRKYLWLQVFLFVTSGILFVLTLMLSDSSSKTVSASGFKVVLSVILGYLLLNERQHPKRLFVATVLSFIGILLLFQ
jgi:drug/metabolite transporter (DMT)-like permease